jgi:hypothetical protein
MAKKPNGTIAASKPLPPFTLLDDFDFLDVDFLDFEFDFLDVDFLDFEFPPIVAEHEGIIIYIIVIIFFIYSF